MANIFKHIGSKEQKFIYDYEPIRGSFEVHFMGIKLFSKINSKIWPSFPLVSDKCV